jgi:hypothetical protein
MSIKIVGFISVGIAIILLIFLIRTIYKIIISDTEENIGLKKPVNIEERHNTNKSTLNSTDALSIVLKFLEPHETKPRLTLIKSGNFITAEGESNQWELFFLCPEKKALATFEINTYQEGFIDIKGKITPFLEEKQIINSIENNDKTCERLWNEEISKPFLNRPIKSSAIAAKDFHNQGLNFSTDLTDHSYFCSRIKDTSEAVWHIYVYDADSNEKYYETDLYQTNN